MGLTTVRGAGNGVPPELMVQLCTEAGAHPHFCMPAMALTPMTDYVTSLASYCRDNGSSWMIPRYEGPNETWNTAAGFHNAHYGNAIGVAYGWGAGDYNNWYGRVMSTIGQAVSTVYSADRSRYQVLCGVQTTSTPTSAQDARLSSAKYILQTPQSPYTATPAKNWVTHVCCAQYFGPSDYGTPAETTAAANYESTHDPAIPIAYEATVNSGSGPYILTTIAGYYSGWKSWAQGFGVQKMCGYEGGYSPDYQPGQREFGIDNPIDRLRDASRLVTALQAHTTSTYNSFIGLTGGGFVAEFPSNYLLADNFNIHGYNSNVWAVLSDIYGANTPQWNAIVAFNA